MHEKSSSAKTITLRGSSTPSSPLQQAASPEANSASEKAEPQEEEEAATKIQAAFRGHQTRKSMKQPDKSAASEPEPSQEQLEAEFRADDVGRYWENMKLPRKDALINNKSGTSYYCWEKSGDTGKRDNLLTPVGKSTVHCYMLC